jgi:hypothetical protein
VEILISKCLSIHLDDTFVLLLDLHLHARGEVTCIDVGAPAG